MGQRGFVRRFSKAVQALVANSEQRLLDEMNAAQGGTLTVGTMLQHTCQAIDDSVAVLQALSTFGGSPVLPNVFISSPAAGVVIGASEQAFLDEPVPIDPLNPADDRIAVTPPVLQGGTAPADTLQAAVQYVPPAGGAREEIKVTVTAAPAPKVGLYFGIVFRTDLKREIATVTVQVTP